MKVLIVEDDKILSETIKECISNIFKVDQSYDGETGIYMALQKIYDVIILDLMMPLADGFEVIKAVRKEKISTPILILTAKDSLKDKLNGFNLGADDYLVKPFQREELIARLEALIRRTTGAYDNNVIMFKDLQMNINTRVAKIKDKELILQGKQFDMLEYLINYKNRILTKSQIFDRIWGFDSDTTTNVVEVYASGIRKELKQYDYDKYIYTIRGIGYMMSGENDE